MRILLVNTLYYPYQVGGAERSTQILAEALARIGHDVFVATLSPGKDRHEARINGVQVHYLPVKNVYYPFGGENYDSFKKVLWHTLDAYNPFMALGFGKLLTTINPQLVHTHNLAGFSVSVWKEAKKREIPLVHTARDYYLLCPRATMYRNEENCKTICFDCRLFSKPKRSSARYVDVIVGISQFILKRHLEYGYFSHAQKFVVYNSHGLVIQKPKSVRASCREVRFGYMGRLHPTKGVEVLLRSFLNLPKGRAELWIAGEGDSEYVSKLRKLSSRGGVGVRWLGLTHVEEFFAEIDVLVVPSLWHEPMGRVIAEAFAYGIPVIGSNRGAIPELVGDAGWIFNPAEPEALEALLRKLLDRPSELEDKRFLAANRAKLFSVEHMIAKYLRIYKLAIEGGGLK